MPERAKIAPTATTCSDFRLGTASDLTQILYGVKNGKINNVAPGVLFYYTHITVPAILGAGGSFTTDVAQTNTDSDVPFFGVHNSGVDLFNGTDCSTATVTTHVTITLGGGNVQLAVSGATPGQTFILSVKYNPGSVVGTSTSVFIPPVHYNWATLVDGVLTETDPDGLDLAPKP